MSVAPADVLRDLRERRSIRRSEAPAAVAELVLQGEVVVGFGGWVRLMGRAERRRRLMRALLSVGPMTTTELARALSCTPRRVRQLGTEIAARAEHRPRWETTWFALGSPRGGVR